MYPSKEFYKWAGLITALSTSSPQAHGEGIIVDPFDFELSDIKLVTPSLLTESASESPVSITKLQSDDLELLGIYNIVDALRLVPGMLIADEFGSGAVVGYHGTNVNVPRRMEVLFNGSSIYRPGYAGVNWQRLSLDLADLSGIEVIRGASVVDFGSNAFQATVNFIQKPLATMPNAKFEATLADNTERIWAGAKVSLENGQIFTRLFQEESDGFDLSATGKVVDDSYVGKNILVNGIFDFGDNSLFDFSLMTKRYDFDYPGFLGSDIASTLAVANGTIQRSSKIIDNSDNIILKVSSIDTFNNMDADWSIAANINHVERIQPIRQCSPAYLFDPLLAEIDASPNINLVSTDFDLMFRTGFVEGNAQINDSIVNPLSESDFRLLNQLGQRMQAIGIEPIYSTICGTTNTDVNEKRYSLNGRIKVNINNSFVYSGTVEVKRDRAESMTYLGGKVDSDSYNVSSNIQYSSSSNNIFNVGIMFEDNDRTDSAFSYRASYIHQLGELHSLRFTYSVSERLPDIYETERNWRFFHKFEDGFVDYLGQTEGYFFRTSRSPSNLKPETNRTVELGYHLSGEFNKYQMDVKIFREKFENMISEPFDFFNFNLTNSGENALTGFESGAHYQFQRVKLGMSYMYLDSDTQTPFEKSLYSRHSGSLYAITKFGKKLTLGSTFTGSSGIGGTEHLRFDNTISYRGYLYDTDYLIQLTLRHHPKEYRTFTEFSATSPNIVRYENRNQLMLNASLNF